ncbi:MAG TPA: energy transducer TonB [Rhodanobacteraceae bacterium]|nr:energy transducer TonB [Rhodanobacteraceae bacterium]
MKHWAWLVFALGLPTVALAAPPQLQESMVVPGTISVNPDGTFKGYTLHEPDKLPPPVRAVIAQTLPMWTFEPIRIDGKPTTTVTTTGMQLHVVATVTHGDSALLQIVGASFGCEAWKGASGTPAACPPDRNVSYSERRPPPYPVAAARNGVSGEVLLMLQIGRDGKVVQAIVHQVNLYTQTSDAAYYRNMLAKASLRTARKWIFRAPTEGPDALKGAWTVTVPINFILPATRSFACTAQRRYGSWCAYLPGPVTPAPWVADQHGGDAGAIAGDGLFVGDPRLVLETPLGPHHAS